MSPKSSSLIPILILCAAIAIWIYDASRDAPPRISAPAEPTAATSIQKNESPTTAGGYETYPNCTLAPDRGNDGDSFRIKLPGGRSEIFRLYFIDTPESAFKSYGGAENNHRRIDQQAADMGGITPQQAVEIGKKAKSFTLATLEKSPFTIHTIWDSPFNDQRYHAFIEVTMNGKPRLLHELLIENGLARIHTKGAKLPDGTPEGKHETHLHSLQRTSKANEAGAWGL